jgi:hypothetical protein
MQHQTKLILKATSGVGVERIRLLLDADASEAEGLALLGTVLPQVEKLDRLIRSTGHDGHKRGRLS